MKAFRSHSPAFRGSAILIALVFVFGVSVALTAWMYLTAARLRQAEAMLNSCQRHVTWPNSTAINQQYTFVSGFQNGVTNPAATATVASGWGGYSAGAYTAMNAFTSTQRGEGGTYAYAYNNIQVPPTSDGSVYFSRTSGTSDSSQSEHWTLYNYLKTYPRTLLGDLFLIHLRPAAASTGAVFTQNFSIGGRVVIMDSSATTSNKLYANSCLNTVIGGTNTTSNASGSALQLPDNYPHVAACTAGYGGSSTPTAVTDGSLNMINNANFPPGSLQAIVQATGASNYTVYSSTTPSGTSSSPVQVTNQASPTYPAPSTSPYGYTPSSPMKVITVDLLNSALTHVIITGAFDQLVLQGQTDQTDYTTADSLPPVIVMLQNTTTQDIRFVGENNRRLILSTGTGVGETIYMGFSGTSSLAGSALRWRLHLINEYCSLWFSPPSGSNVSLTGSIRTNWSVNCTDTTTATRFSLQLESSPGGLETLLPRDGWNEPYFLNQ